ncbi:MAG: type III-A CRISPR-associated RAMP protein Csm3 [Fibromonadaceae bacterium]|jgi:CRISPR-associated protein Csm3|nr:type III-A CRISPR-associated RAMP protein Csm3 [Fibromonadaceae bacterium]
MKQIATKTLKGTIKVLTGLHIGAGNDRVEIGGMDNPIIRNPLNKEPYVPGSSLKGKIRSLLEWNEGKITDGEPCKCGGADCLVCKIFGTANNSKDGDKTRGPTRIIFRDAFLTDESREKFKTGKIIEEKAENSINRITAKANPRPIERVVPGIEFDFEIVIRVLEGDKENELVDFIKNGLMLLQNDFLGGGGSRGSGKIEFKYEVV